MTRPTRTPWPFPTAESHPKPAPQPEASEPKSVQVQDVSEPALDHGVEESFPASDPVSVVPTKVVPAKDKAGTTESDDTSPAADAAKGGSKANTP